MKKTGLIIGVGITVLVVVGVVGFLFMKAKDLAHYPALTACLRDNNVIMFGAYWCPECANQKAAFERGAKDIPYFECSPDGQGSPQAPECAERLVYSYPTWQFDEDLLASLPDDVWQPYGVLYDNQVAEGTLAEDEILEEGASNLQKMKAIKVGEDRYYYNQGRIGGRRTLDELALFGGCEEALATDRNSQS